MAMPTTPSKWTQSLDLPSRVFGNMSGFFGGDDYELYEEDDEFVLTIDLPGFDREEIELAWYNGRLNISAEHEDEERGRKRTYHRSFRFPKDIDEDAISATYENGVLEVTLPAAGEAARGTSIPIEG